MLTHEKPLTDRRVEYEAVHSVPRGEYEHGCAAVERVAGRDQLPPGLEDVAEGRGTLAQGRGRGRVVVVAWGIREGIMGEIFSIGNARFGGVFAQDISLKTEGIA